jgi:hypothetical protein
MNIYSNCFEQTDRDVAEGDYDAVVENKFSENSSRYQAMKRPTPLPPNPAAPWYPKSRILDVHGHRIAGMAYIGSGLIAAKGLGIEPALIDPSLRVYTPDPSYTGQDLPYWPSYTDLSPHARGRFLRWLAEGRQDRQIAIGFVFLFYYGLERRLLADDCPAEERAELIEEIERLRTLYSADVSFGDYSFRLLDFLRAEDLEPFCVRLDDYAAPPVSRSCDQPFGSTLRVGLGQCAADGMEVPVAWALAWAESQPGYRQRTPAERCRREFEKLFHSEYDKRFPQGQTLRSDGPKIRLDYRPASASFSRSITMQSTLPDVTVFDEPGATLQDIAMNCVRQLDAYSRFLRRYPGAEGTGAALALLPESLFGSQVQLVVPDLGEWLDTRLEGGYGLVDYSTLLARCASLPGDRLKKDSVVQVLQLLERLGVGVEPDPGFETDMPAFDRPIVLFRLEEEQPRSASTAYVIAVTALTLAIAVRGAEKGVLLEEDESLEGEISKMLDLSPGEKRRLRARRLWLGKTGVNLKSLRKPIAALSTKQREEIGTFLLELAHAGGQVSPAAIDTLTKAYRLLNFNPWRVFSAVHAYATEPVSVSRGQSVPPQHLVPHAPGKTISPDSTIDMDKVRAMTSESERVSVLLRDIFLEEDQPGPSISPTKENGLGLDGLHFRFLEIALTNESWSRADLTGIAKQCQVMVEGAIDRLNDLALDRYQDPLFEGHDPI